jgi:UDP-glucuronate decarboxylase
VTNRRFSGERLALVTGGAGFLGSYVCEQFLKSGLEVVCFDNLSTGRSENIAHLRRSTSFTFVEGDVREALPVRDYDQIWNLASPASPQHYQRDPVGTLLTNVMGTHHALQMAARSGAKFLQASTSEVYGDPQVHPQVETYMGAVNTIGPRACYDEGKRAAEALCFDYWRQHGVRIKVARIFNTYGPRMDANDGRVVSNFIVRALNNEPLEIYGAGGQTRSFCYRDDLVEGLFRLMASDDAVTGPVNLGNPAEFTMLELAGLIVRLTSSESLLVHRALPADDPKQRRPDISLALRSLGWMPAIELESGLRRTISYFAEQRRSLETADR